MAKTLKECQYDFERFMSYAIKNMADDCKEAKISGDEVDVTILQILSHAICTMAYVGGMKKDEFLEAMAASWDETKKSADEAKERLEKYMEGYEKALKDAVGQCDCPDCKEKKEPPLKN